MSNQEGFLKLRNGLREHVAGQQFSPSDLGVYTFLHLNKNWRTGICWTNCQSIATQFNVKRSSINDSFRRLKARGYIDYPEGTGSRSNYPVLLINDEPTHGLFKGMRLVGFHAEPTLVPRSTDADHPVNEQKERDLDVVTYSFFHAEPTETQLRVIGDRTVTGRWVVRSTDADRTVTVPLPDLQDFKTFKTLPDLEDDSKQPEDKAAGRLSKISDDQDQKPTHGENTEPQASMEDGANMDFRPECMCDVNCFETQKWCKAKPVPRQYRCSGCELPAQECQDKQACPAGKQRAFAAKWGSDTRPEWVNKCRGCEDEFHTFGRPNNGFHSYACYTKWREAEDAKLKAAHPDLFKAPKKERLAAFLDGE